MITVRENSTLYKYICEMFLEEVPAHHIAKHFKLQTKTVKEVLAREFGEVDSRNYKSGNHLRRRTATSVPVVTEPDIFLCQFALLANINRKHIEEFVAKVWQYYPNTMNGVDSGTKKFRTTPPIDSGADLDDYHHPSSYWIWQRW